MPKANTISFSKMLIKTLEIAQNAIQNAKLLIIKN